MHRITSFFPLWGGGEGWSRPTPSVFVSTHLHSAHIHSLRLVYIASQEKMDSLFLFLSVCFLLSLCLSLSLFLFLLSPVEETVSCKRTVNNCGPKKISMKKIPGKERERLWVFSWIVIIISCNWLFFCLLLLHYLLILTQAQWSSK